MLRAINGVNAVGAMQQDVKFEVLYRCYIQIYPAKILVCYDKKYRSLTYEKFRVK